MKNIITRHPYDGCWSLLWSVILTMLQNKERTGLMFMMPKISTVVLKTSYWYPLDEIHRASEVNIYLNVLKT